MLNAGKYAAVAVDAAFQKASTGTPMVVIRFDLPTAGTSRTWRGFLTEKTKGRTVEILRAMGAKGADLSSIIGAEVNVVIGHEIFNGKVFDKIKWVNPPGLKIERAPLKSDPTVEVEF